MKFLNAAFFLFVLASHAQAQVQIQIQDSDPFSNDTEQKLTQYGEIGVGVTGVATLTSFTLNKFGKFRLEHYSVPKVLTKAEVNAVKTSLKRGQVVRIYFEPNAEIIREALVEKNLVGVKSQAEKARIRKNFENYEPTFAEKAEIYYSELSHDPARITEELAYLKKQNIKISSIEKITQSLETAAKATKVTAYVTGALTVVDLGYVAWSHFHGAHPAE